ncbi:hypothetical protein [Cellulomonas sp. Y8]|uniref:hypothetical protein n=1 Tax=Cellulomonas sp. Y8 TaxID=2591145 RepID=UPI0011C6FBCC|nr:hypothetical protein [Cellulomonas sp. Y8]
MGAQIARLTEAGEPAAWQRALLDVDEPERKRLRALADGIAPLARAPMSPTQGPAGVATPDLTGALIR